MQHEEWSIQDTARAAGVTSRTLRHYDRIGLVKPARVGDNGYRYYDERALVRLQRVLLLRGLGLGLEAIGDVLAAQDSAARDASARQSEARILTAHLDLLRQERDRIAAQMGAVERTIRALEAAREGSTVSERSDVMSARMFEGFDHTQYREEVEERWGADAYRTGDAWWRGMSAEERAEWQGRSADLARDWADAAARGDAPESRAAQDLARRQVEWLRSVPGTDRACGGDFAGYVRGLGELYVADARFAANYGGAEGAAFVRDALAAYVDRVLAG